jgi:xanthine dehydrogenase molybdenum-binding subunit
MSDHNSDQSAAESEMMELAVNGEARLVQAGAGEMLSDVLRYQLGLTGTKIACEEAECGTCTVLIDGQPVLSCVYPAMKAAGRQIKTIEGLSENGRLHPLQEAFVKFGAVQCGFCIPGQIMTASALIESNPDPTEAEIRKALKDTLCRCAGYPTIIRSIQAAADSIRTGNSMAEPKLPLPSKMRVIGQLVPRPDAVEKVNGSAKFTDDYSFPGMLYGATLRAGTPHAILRKLDISAASKAEGVVRVLTAEDIPGEINHGLVIKDWPALVGIGEKVRYVGDAIAVVAADTHENAQRTLHLIEVEYEDLPVISDPVQARGTDAPNIHVDGNLLKHIKVRKGDLEAGFEEADVILEDTYHTAITEHAFLEPECAIARVTEEGRIEVYVGSQIPYADRSQIARSLDMADDEIRVIGTLIGGGFGGKEDIAGQIHAALLAKETGQPVKMLYDRHESLLVHPKRHATQIRVKLGAKIDGSLVAVETELYGDTGAYASLGEKVMTRATTHSAGPYIVPHVKADCYAMYTNNPPAGAFRGFGVTQSAFAFESMMDDLAEQLDIDPIELRRNNALEVGSVTNTGQELTESAGLIECINQVTQRMQDYSAEPFVAWTPEGEPRMRRAWGFAAAYKNTGLGGGAPDKASAEVELYEDGTAEVRTSSAEIGQGLVAVIQMIAAEELTLPPNKVRVLLSDTDLTPDGGPTTASRHTYVTGNAVRHATDAIKQAVATTLAEHYDVPPVQIEFHEGLAQVNGHQVTFGEAAKIMKEEGREARATYEYWAPSTQALGTGGDMHFAFSFAAQAAEVEVNMDTGEVEVLRVIAANDVGKVINPLGFLGQIEGGVMMGLGNAITEHFIVEQGRVVTDRLARYRMPGIMQAPEIISIPVEHPAADGPYGAKGVGEISSIPTTPAITNAIFRACGVRIRSLPVDQDWLALEIVRQGEDS